MRSKFPVLPRKSTGTSYGHVRKLNIFLAWNDFVDELKPYLQNKLSDFPNFSAILVLAIKIIKLKANAVILNEKLNVANNFLYTQ